MAKIENTSEERIEQLVQRQREFFSSGKTRSIPFRKEMLHRFENGLRKWEKPLTDALWKDLHKSYEYWHPIYRWESSCQGTVPQAIIAFLDSTNFEDAMRKAVSLGGDSDTLACITGGIAEAFYKEIPRSMAERVARPFPGIFNKILDAVRVETVYGETCKIAD